MMAWMKYLVAMAAMLTCGAAMADVRLQGAGATFPNPLYQKWVTEFQKLHPDMKIDYQSIGSGGGIKGITEKTIDFAGSDAPMSKKELAAAGAPVVHIPTVAGSVVPAYNLPGFSGALNLSGPVIADIYLGKINRWNDAAIAQLNPGVNLPNLPITPVWRTDGSGTTFVFTNYMITQSDEFKGSIGAGKQVQWPVGQGGKGNEGVAAATQATPGAIGYMEVNYANQNNIPHALVQNKDGKFVKATPESVAAAGEGALKAMESSLAVDIWNQPGEKAYPISAFTYIIVYNDLGHLKDANKAKALVQFLSWATSEVGGQKMAGAMDYAPLSAGVQKRVHEVLGTLVCEGQPVMASN